MRFLSRGASGAAGMAGLIATVAAAAGTGTAVSAITFGGLQGGTWTISSNSFFTIDSATGVVKTTATPTVSGTTYTPTVTMTYAQSGLNVTASGVMSILASTAAPAPTPTPTPNIAYGPASKATSPFPYAFGGETPDIDINLETGQLRIAGLPLITTLAQAATAGLYNSTTKVLSLDTAVAQGATLPTGATVPSDIEIRAWGTPASAASEYACALHNGTSGYKIELVRTSTNDALLRNTRNGSTISIVQTGGMANSGNNYISAKARYQDWHVSGNGVDTTSNTSSTVGMALNLNKLQIGAAWDGSGPWPGLKRLSIWYNRHAAISRWALKALSRDPFNPQANNIFGGTSNPRAYSDGANKTIVGGYNDGPQFFTIYHDGVTPPHLYEMRRSTSYGATQHDDHNVPTVYLLPNGEVISAQTGHGVSTTMPIFIGSSINAGTMTPIISAPYNGTTPVVNVGQTAPSSEYTQIFRRDSDGRLYVFTKGNDYGWGYFISDDNGRTWTTFRMIVVDTGLTQKNYIRGGWIPGEAGRLRFYVNDNSSGGTVLYLMEFDTNTGKVYSGNGSFTQVEVLDVTTAPVATGAVMTNLTILRGAGGVNVDASFVPVQVRRGAAMVQIGDKGPTPTQVEYHVVSVKAGGNRWNPADWTYSRVGTALYQLFNGAGSLGGYAAFNGAVPDGQPMEVFTASRDATHDIGEHWRAADQYGAGPWTKLGTVYKFTHAAPFNNNTFRVISPVNASPRFPVLWCGSSREGAGPGSVFNQYDSYDGFTLEWPGAFSGSHAA